MAAKNVSIHPSLSNFIVEGTAFTYDRFAEDFLSYLYSTYKVEKRCIPLPRYAENFYKHPLVIHYITRQTKLDQILYRGFWHKQFTKGNVSVQIKNDITELYKYVADNLRQFKEYFEEELGKKCPPNVLFHVSFAFVLELTLFFFLKKNKTVIKKMSRVWVSYFTNYLKEDFEAYGGLSRVLRKTNKSFYMDNMISDFIETHCIPYTGECVHEAFKVALDDVETKYRLQKQLDGQIDELKDMTYVQSLSEFLGNSSDDDKPELDPRRDLEVDERLGIVPHEQILKKYIDVNSPPRKEAPPADTESATKAIAALSLQAERRKAEKLAKEQSSCSVAKAPVQHHKVKQPAVNLGASGEEDTAEHDAKSHERVVPIQLDDDKEIDPLRDLKFLENLGLVPQGQVLESYVNVKPSPRKETALSDADESRTKAIAALALKAERRKARKLAKVQSSYSVAKALVHHHGEKRPVVNEGASDEEATDESDAGPCDRLVPHEQVLEKYVDVQPSPQIEAAVVDADESRTNYSMAKAPVLHHHREKQPALNVGDSGKEGTEEPDAKSCDRVPLVQQDQSQAFSVSLKSPIKSSSDETKIDYSLQGARPKIRK